MEETMMLVRSVLFSVALSGVAIGAVACGGTVEHSPQTTASALTKAPVGTGTHGMVRVVGDALGEVNLRPDQRVELEKLAQDAEARHAPMVERRKEVMLAVADQIEQGAIDRAALQVKIDTIAADMDKVGTDDRSALVKLHDVLDGDQRNAFVDALEKQMKAKHGEHGMQRFARMKQLADDLKLTDAQRSQIHDIMRESFKDMHQGGPGEQGHHVPPGMIGARGYAPGKHLLDAFREDKLDVSKMGPPHAAKEMIGAGATHVMTIAEKILPILTPEQRKIAADKLRTAAASGEPMLFEQH
jgi:Spy/CpxP family protein refolding chaperone